MSKNNFIHRGFDLHRFFKNEIRLWPIPLIFFSLLLWTGCGQEEKEIPPPEIFLGDAEGGMEVEVGDTIRIEPKITYNYDAYYEWRKDQIPLDYTGINLESVPLELGTFEYFFKVTTPTGADSVTIPIDVMIKADFQELTLEESTYWVGDQNSSGFSNQGIWHPNMNGSTDAWWGFGYSNIFSKVSTLPIEPYSAYATSVEEDIFALVRQTSQANLPTITMEDNRNHLIKSLDITNSTYGRYLMKYGTDEFLRLGGPSGTNADWCKVTITGLDTDNVVTGQIEFYLADYRFDNNKRDYIIDDWQVINLTQLGKVSQLQFHLTSSILDDQQQMMTPEYFCINNLKILD